MINGFRMSSKKNVEFVNVKSTSHRFRPEDSKKQKRKKRTDDYSNAAPGMSTFYPLQRFSSSSSPADVVTFVGKDDSRSRKEANSSWEIPNLQAMRPRSADRKIERRIGGETERPRHTISSSSSLPQALPKSASALGDHFADHLNDENRPDLVDSAAGVSDDDTTHHGWFDVIDVNKEQLSVEATKEIYKLEVNRLHVLTPLDSSSKEFAVPGFNRQWKTKNEYFIIKRKAVTVTDSISGCKDVWAYTCSCNKSNQNFLSNLGCNLLCSEQELSSIQSCCLHMEVVSDILKNFDLRNSILPCERLEEDRPVCVSEVVELQNNHSLVFVRFENKAAFVSLEMGKLRCSSCTYEAYKCCHVSYVRTLAEGRDLTETTVTPDVVVELIAKEQEWLPGFSLVQKPTSYSAIPFELSSELADKISFGYRSYLTETAGLFHLAPNEHICSNCQGSLDSESCSGPISLYTLLDTIPCKVTWRRCPTCDHVIKYDGSSDGVLNMGRFLVGYDVLRDYMYHFVYSNSCTLYGYYCIWKQKQVDHRNKDFPKVFNYQHWRASWYAYLNLLDIDFSKWDVCSECGSTPDMIVCDGTSLGFRKQLLVLTETQNQAWEKIPRRSHFKDRLAIPDTQTRCLLQRWSEGIKRGVLDGLNEEETEKLDFLLENKYPAIFPVYCWVKENFDTAPVVEISRFFSCLCSKSPVCAYVPATMETKNMLENICGLRVKEMPSLFQRLRDEIPFFYDILSLMQGNSFPSEWQEFFSWLSTISFDPFSRQGVISGPPLSFPSEPLSFFPTLPKHRERGAFEIDFQARYGKDDPCVKKSHGHPSLTPGIFTIYCPHGINYGFQAMESKESPNVPFTVFRTRFDKAPKTIIYDNSCNLHAYCLNRDPVYFQNTKFLVDRFHWKNHTGCCIGYKMALYPKHDSINSQVNEQQNSTLKKLRAQLSYMGPDNFMLHCQFFFWYRNRLTMKKL